MLVFGQKRTKEIAALAAEPGCERDSNRGKFACQSHAALLEFQGQITAPTGGSCSCENHIL